MRIRGALWALPGPCSCSLGWCLPLREPANRGGLSLPICARRQRGRTGPRSASEMGVSRERGKQRGLHQGSRAWAPARLPEARGSWVPVLAARWKQANCSPSFSRLPPARGRAPGARAIAATWSRVRAGSQTPQGEVRLRRGPPFKAPQPWPPANSPGDPLSPNLCLGQGGYRGDAPLPPASARWGLPGAQELRASSAPCALSPPAGAPHPP